MFLHASTNTYLGGKTSASVGEHIVVNQVHGHAICSYFRHHFCKEPLRYTLNTICMYRSAGGRGVVCRSRAAGLAHPYCGACCSTYDGPSAPHHRRTGLARPLPIKQYLIPGMVITIPAHSVTPTIPIAVRTARSPVTSNSFTFFIPTWFVLPANRYAAPASTRIDFAAGLATKKRVDCAKDHLLRESRRVGCAADSVWS